MRNIASRFTSARAVAVAALAATGGVLVLGTSGQVMAATTVNAPTITASFTPAEIGVTGSSTITYTITNPNSSGTLYNVGFTDTLPSIVTIDDPTNATTSGCGSPTVGASPGNGVDGASGITLKAGTPCTVEVSIVGNSVGNEADAFSGFTYSTSASGAALTAPASDETPASLDVLAAPTIVITAPKNNATYSYGQKVKAVYACTAPSDAGSTLSACLGQDDLGNAINPGQYLDTTVPGVHYLQVQALDNDGDSVNAQVSYTVLFDNVVTIKSAKTAKNGVIDLALGVPGAGTLKLAAVHAGTTVATATEKVSTAHRSLALKLAPTNAGQKLLVAAHNKLKATLRLTFTPRGGKSYSVTKTITLI